MQLKILMQYIPREKEGYIKERNIKFMITAEFLTKESQSKSKEDTRAFSHLPAKLQGSEEVHGYANKSNHHVRDTGGNRRDTYINVQTNDKSYTYVVVKL